MGMDLDEFRRAEGLTYEQLAKLIGATSPGQARFYALGITWPRQKRLERILKATGGKVDLNGLYRRRVAYARRHARPIASMRPDAGASP